MEFYANHIKEETSKDKIDKLFNKIKDKNIFSHRQALNFEELIVTENKENVKVNEGHMKHQFLRSASMWSLGLGSGQD